jgi:hypothetical protein
MKPLVVASPVARAVALGQWCVVGFLLGVVLSHSLQTSQSTLTPVGVATLVVVGILGGAWSASRIKFLVDESGITITNPLGTWRCPWEEVASVGVKYLGISTQPGVRPRYIVSGATPPVVGVRRRDGRYVPGAFATMHLSERRRTELVGVLAELGLPRGTAVEVTPQDL